MIFADIAVYIFFMTGVIILDIKKYMIPLLNVYLCSVFLFAYRVFFNRKELYLYIFAAIFSFLIFLVVFIFSRGKLGFGDVQLCIPSGLLTGFPGIFTALTVSSLSAVLFLLIFYPFKRKFVKLPFAPFLVFGSLIERLFHTSKTVEELFSLL